MEIKFDKDPVAVEKNNHLTKIANVYIVCDLEAWPTNPNNFKFKNCLFGATNIVTASEKYVYSGYRVTFDSAGSWSFHNDFARNVIIFVVGNSSSFHSDNHKNSFLISGAEGPTDGINERKV